MELGSDWEWGAFWLSSVQGFALTLVAFMLALWLTRWQFRNEQRIADVERKESERQWRDNIERELRKERVDRERIAIAEVYGFAIECSKMLSNLREQVESLNRMNMKESAERRASVIQSLRGISEEATFLERRGFYLKVLYWNSNAAVAIQPISDSVMTCMGEGMFRAPSNLVRIDVGFDRLSAQTSSLVGRLDALGLSDIAAESSISQ